MDTIKHSNEYINNREIRPLRITCLLGALFSPIIALTWVYLFFTSGFMVKVETFFYSGLFSLLFLGVYVLSYKSSFVRKYAYYILYAICYFSAFVILDFTHKSHYPEYQVFLLFFMFFAVVLILKKISHLILYMSIMVILTLISLFTVGDTHTNKGNMALFMFLFLIISYVSMKFKMGIQKELDKSEEHYRNLVEISPLGILVHREGKIIYTNPVFLEMMGLSRKNNIIGKPIVDLIHPDHRDVVKFEIEKSFVYEKLDFIEQKLVLLDGRSIEVEAESIGVNHRGQPAVMSIFKDITDRKNTERKLIEAESRYRSLIESALVGVFLYQNRFIYVNPYLEQLLGYSKEEFYRMSFSDIIFSEDIHLLEHYNLDCLGTDTIKQFRIQKKNKSIIYVEVHATRTIYNGTPTVIVTLLDISHIKKSEEQIKFIAYHDSLTGLPNRYKLNEYLYKIISQSGANRLNKSSMGIMLVDLDRFKMINDSLGHSFGDIVLKEAAQRLKACVGVKDMVFRYGGDEFVILLPDTDKTKSSHIANKITEMFRCPFVLNDKETFSTSSVGISLFPQDGDHAEILLKNADIAMYVAKATKNNYQFYSESFNKELLRKMELENGLRKALENNEFILYYQPQIDLNSGKIVGLEALIRWHHPEYGLVYPAEFIPLAEETGLIVPIGKWVIETACRQNKAWQDMGYSNIPVAVNVSAYQILHSDLSSTVSDTLDKTGLDPQYLILEITESIMQDIDKTYEIIHMLKSFNVKVAIDDFGTGYSSISLLKNLKFDILKIDPSFTVDLKKDQSSIALVKLIIDFACQLSYTIIAEGVEDEEQAKILTEKGCNCVQGYYYSKPVAAERIEEILNAPILC